MKSRKNVNLKVDPAIYANFKKQVKKNGMQLYFVIDAIMTEYINRSKQEKK